MKNIAIFTTFYKWDEAYSLTGVVSQQLQALVKHGYSPTLFVLENFYKEDLDKIPQGVTLKAVIPQLILEPYGARVLPENFESDVEKTVKVLQKEFQQIDICLTHDIIFINSYLPYNAAIRKLDLPKLKWLHWMHSGPSVRPANLEEPWSFLYSLPAHSKLIYMNHTDTIRAAEMYGIWEKDVRVVYNPMDPRITFNMHSLSRKIIDDYKLLEAEVVDIYPLSSTRMGPDGKNLAKVIYLMGQIKEQGKTVKLVIPNAHANAEREKNSIAEMMSYAEANGLTKDEVIFTSLIEAPVNEHGVPHEVVLDLFKISNLFIFPSVSENCPLVLLEAAITKNLLVLNSSFPAFREFGGSSAIYALFGSLLDEPRHPGGEGRYLGEIAKIIVAELNNTKVLGAFNRIQRKFNMDKVFKDQLEPIFYEDF